MLSFLRERMKVYGERKVLTCNRQKIFFHPSMWYDMFGTIIKSNRSFGSL